MSAAASTKAAPAKAAAGKDEATAAPEASTGPLVDRRAIKAHMIAGFVFFFAGLFAGMLYALQFSRLYPFPGVELLSPGRVRMLHTQAVAYGFLLNLFMACMHWIIPRLAGRPVLSKKLSWVVFWAWQATIAAVAVTILMGYGQAIEWGETPTFLDPVIILGAALMIANFATPIIKAAKGKKLYVTLWYFSAMMIWLPLTYAMGNFVPQYFVPGAGGAAITGLYIHDLVGLTITPLGWGMMYYFVPILLKKPVWSHTMSLVGFWGLAFFYPLNGVHHFFFSPIPMYAQYGAVMSTIAVELVVLTVIINFFMTMRGSGGALRSSIPMRYFFTGMVLYGVTCLQCAFQTTLTFQKVIHFSDWVVGHAHLVMFGVFGSWCIGAVMLLWPKVTGRAWWSAKLNSWSYWLITVGTVVMFLDLLVAGMVQGYLWQNLAPWEQSLVSSMPFWHLRSISGIAIVSGAMLVAYNMWMTARQPAEAGAPARVEKAEAIGAAVGGVMKEKLAGVVLGAGLFCFALAAVVTGYLPVAHLSRIEYKTLEQIAPEASSEFKDLARRYPASFGKHYGKPTAAAFHKALRKGRDIYIAEACWHCHSQFIRPVSNEDVRFGKVSWAGEYMNEMFLPHLFGTRRVGPDLIRENGRHGNDWHTAHFWDPTQVVPTSVMPRYPWFFDGAEPNARGIAIITYVQWLGSWATPEALAARAAAAPAKQKETR